MRGEFREGPNDAHARRRREVLERQEWYPEIEPPVRVAWASEEALPLVRGHLAQTGFVGLSIPSPMTANSLASLAMALGYPAERVGEVIERKTVWRSAPENARDHIDSQHYLVMHTEGVFRRLAVQPSHIVLQCLCPPHENAGGQTLLIPFQPVAARLNRRQRSLLSHTFPATPLSNAPILSNHSGAWVFHFRDPGGEVFQWNLDDRHVSSTSDEVNGAIASLILAMYAQESIRGVHWRTGMICCFSNKAYFHGRSSMTDMQAGATRHLREIELQASSRASLASC